MSNDAVESAVRYFSEDYNCAESVFKALAEAVGIEGPFVPRIATGFGAGMGRHGNVCGAVSGAVLAISMVYGRDDAQGSREPSYAKVSELLQAVQQEFGNVGCLDLTGYNLLTPEGRAGFKENNVHANVCAKLVAFCVKEGLRLLEK